MFGSTKPTNTALSLCSSLRCGLRAGSGRSGCSAAVVVLMRCSLPVSRHRQEALRARGQWPRDFAGASVCRAAPKASPLVLLARRRLTCVAGPLYLLGRRNR